MLNFIIIFIFIIILFYISNKYLFKKNINEHYLTYFLPFYNKKTNALSNFYENNENNLNYFKKKFNYDLIKFGIGKNDEEFIKYTIANYISKSNLYEGKIILYNDILKSLYELSTNKINFCMIDYASLIYFNDDLNENIKNIKLVSTLYNLYIYVFTKKIFNIFSLNDLPYNCSIGILDFPNPISLYYSKFLKDLGYKENVDYTIKKYKTFEELSSGFEKNEFQLIIIIDHFPNNNIKYFLDHFPNNDTILLPFDIIKEELFLKKNSIVNIDYIDLNLLSHSFLPKKFGKYEYTVYRPNFKIAYIQKILLSNTETDEKYTYSLIKFFHENLKFINNNLSSTGYKINNIGIDNINTGYIDYHIGVLNYFNDKGFITNIDNDNCKYFVGKMECNEKNLKNNIIYL